MGLDTVLALRPCADISLKYLRGSNGRCEHCCITDRRVDSIKQAFPVKLRDPLEVLVQAVSMGTHKPRSSLEEPER